MVETREKNKRTHPAKLAGVAAIPREETKAKRATEKAIKEKKKLEKVEKRASTIRKLAAEEQKGTESYADMTTPRAPPLQGREVERRAISSPPSAKELEEESDLSSEPFIPDAMSSESELTTADEDNNTDISETKAKPSQKRGTQVRQAVQNMKETVVTPPVDEGEETPRPPRTRARNPRPINSAPHGKRLN
jgi:hypothetical protein